MAIDKFWEDLTYDEWYLLQNKESLEFKAIEASHKTHPGFTLEEIKKFIYATIIESENNQKIFEENFGQRHINSDKLNQQISRLVRTIFSSTSEYHSIDKRGHGDSISARFGGRGKGSDNIGFRIEEKAIRYAKYIIDHNLVSVPTVSDLVRTGFVKYIEMLPTINEIKGAVTDQFLLDMQIERENIEKTMVVEMIKGFEASMESKEQDLMDILRHSDNKEELEELRDWTMKFIRDSLSFSSPTKFGKGKVRQFIMTNGRLYNILTTLEIEKLVTKEYIDDVRQKGIASTALSLVQTEEFDK